MKQKVALVLSGGGARGMAHIGVIEEVERLGYEISSISGTSMGALVGGVYALGKIEEFKDWLFTLDKMKVFQLLDFTLSTQGLVKGDKVLNAMKEFIDDRNIEDLEIAYAAAATDLINQKEVVFTSGSVYDAIRASISIPSVFKPVKTEHGLLVDGGVVNNLPIANVKRTEGDILIAVDVNANIPVYIPNLSDKEIEIKKSVYRRKLNEFHDHFHKENPIGKNEKLGYFNLIEKTLSLMMFQMTQMSLKYHTPDILINISRDSCSTFDFFKAEEMVEVGKYQAVEAIGMFEKKMNS